MYYTEDQEADDRVQRQPHNSIAAVIAYTYQKKIFSFTT